MNKKRRHYEENTLISTSPQEVFNYVDNHSNFSSHMTKSSWMMGGSRMKVDLDEEKGKKIGSHIKMHGKVLGIELSLDEIVTKREPPKSKIWETVGTPKLLLIGPYQMGLEIKSQKGNSNLEVFIDYELPTTISTRWLGYLFGGIYAKWCVSQMINGTRNHFRKLNR